MANLCERVGKKFFDIKQAYLIGASKLSYVGEYVSSLTHQYFCAIGFLFNGVTDKKSSWILIY